jgi:hypothetical protein
MTARLHTGVHKFQQNLLWSALGGSAQDRGIATLIKLGAVMWHSHSFKSNLTKEKQWHTNVYTKDS